MDIINIEKNELADIYVTKHASEQRLPDTQNPSVEQLSFLFSKVFVILNKHPGHRTA